MNKMGAGEKPRCCLLVLRRNLEQGGLATTVGAEEHPELPGRNVEGATLEHRQHPPPPRRHREPDIAALDGRRGQRRGGRSAHPYASTTSSVQDGFNGCGSGGHAGAAVEGSDAAGEAVRHLRRAERTGGVPGPVALPG